MFATIVFVRAIRPASKLCIPSVCIPPVRALMQSRLLSTEADRASKAYEPRPFMSMTLKDMSGTSGVVAVVLTIIGATLGIGALLANNEHRSDAAIAKLEERMAGVIREVDAKVSGAKESITKEVDAKVSGTKETITKEVDAKMAGTKETIDKEVNAKIAGFEKAADIKVRLIYPTRNPCIANARRYFLTAYLLSPPSPFVVLQEVVSVVINAGSE
jgi:hypothetical protein